MRILFLITFLPFILSANEKLALIIANQNYQYINSLTNPIQGYKTKKVKIELNKPISKRIKLKRKVRYCKLNVIPNVSNASIRILNIQEKYRKNISLPCNKRYDIEVKKNGYKRKLFNTSLKTSETIKPRMSKKYIAPRYCSLTIIPTTNRARVIITNILQTHKRGIRLPCNRIYNIKVSQRGYRTRRVNIRLTKRNEKITINLHRYHRK